MPHKSMLVAPELQEQHIPVMKKQPKVKQGCFYFILNCSLDFSKMSEAQNQSSFLCPQHKN